MEEVGNMLYCAVESSLRLDEWKKVVKQGYLLLSVAVQLKKVSFAPRWWC